MSIRGDAPSCPCSQSLVVFGVLPACRADEVDPDLLAFLADCACAEVEGAGLVDDAGRCGGACGADEAGGGGGGASGGFLVRAMSCGDAAELMGQVRHGRR